MSEADIPKTFHFSTPKTMKAVVCEKHGEKLKICQLPVPVPNDDEVLVKIRASGICHTDVHVCAGDMKSMLPVCPGHEGAGNNLLHLFHVRHGNANNSPLIYPHVD